MICITHVSRKCMILNQSKYVCFVERKGSEVIASIIGCSDAVMLSLAIHSTSCYLVTSHRRSHLNQDDLHHFLSFKKFFQSKMMTQSQNSRKRLRQKNHHGLRPAWAI